MTDALDELQKALDQLNVLLIKYEVVCPVQDAFDKVEKAWTVFQQSLQGKVLVDKQHLDELSGFIETLAPKAIFMFANSSNRLVNTEDVAELRRLARLLAEETEK